MSQKAFAKKLDVAQSTINRIECEDQNVAIETLEKICIEFKCDISDIFPKVKR